VASEGWGGVRSGSPHQQRRWQRKGTHIGHGGDALPAWWPWGHSAEHVACANEPDFGSRFWHVRSIFVPGCLKQVCYSLTTLQHFFRCHGHLSSVSTSN